MLLLILCILVLGYYHVEKIPTEKAKLKRGNNWEAYVILAKHGIAHLLSGFYYLMVLVCFFVVLCLVVWWLLSKISIIPPINIFIHFLLLIAEKPFTHWVLFALTVLVAMVSSSYMVDKFNLNNLSKLKNQDGFLNIVLEAMENGKPVKVSLKSKKIYVGAVYHEQFEQLDLDNLVIVPYLSGYRDKDTLKIIFDCNYTEVYGKYGVQEITSNPNSYHLSDFRLNIKVSEIESISLFHQEMFDDFQKNKENS